jgi:hypothetical protein
MKGEGRQSEEWEWRMREGWRNERSRAAECRAAVKSDGLKGEGRRCEERE